jgi:hypothetical protein
MSMFGKLAFWKKKEDSLGLDLGAQPGQGFDQNLGLEGDIGKSPELGLEQTGQEPGGFGEGFNEQSAIQQPSLSKESVSQTGMRETEINIPGAAGERRPGEVGMNKDVELISSKMDAIKAEVQTINQRLANIERMIENQSEKQRRTW